MTQLPLFPSPPLKGRTPPPAGNRVRTRRAAQEQIAPASAALREQVYRLLADLGEHGATDQEIQAALGMAVSTQVPRRRELVEAGRVTDSGRTRRTASGRKAVVWVIS